MGDRKVQRGIQKGVRLQDWSHLRWHSDWNGDEVGYPDAPIVGLYSTQEGTNLYINIITGEILETWEDEEE